MSEKLGVYDVDDTKDGVAALSVQEPYGNYDKNALELRDAELEQTGEGDHGTKRALSPRICSMIAIAGTIGTGLFLSSGTALAQGGAVGCFLGYLIMGFFIGCMMYCLVSWRHGSGELNPHLPPWVMLLSKLHCSVSTARRQR